MSVFYPMQAIADYVTYNLLGADPAVLWASALNFFIYDTLKIGVLLLLINYFMAIVRHYLPVERIRHMLTSRNWYGTDYLLAALFGVITPFCSCSSIPLFIGFLRARLPLGVIFAFMITSPLVNEASLVLFAGLFGIKITVFYAVSGIIIGVLGGMIISKLNLEKYIEESILKFTQAPIYNSNVDDVQNSGKFNKRLLKEWWIEGWAITKQLMPYVLVGIGIGSIIHGFVPQNFFETYLSGTGLWAVPLATIFAIPLYSNAVGVIPIMQALVSKGVPLGTALAFMMSVVGMSLPELLILRKAVKPMMLFVYYTIVATGIIIIGYTANVLF